MKPQAFGAPEHLILILQLLSMQFWGRYALNQVWGLGFRIQGSPVDTLFNVRRVQGSEFVVRKLPQPILKASSLLCRNVKCGRTVKVTNASFSLACSDFSGSHIAVSKTNVHHSV